VSYITLADAVHDAATMLDEQIPGWADMCAGKDLHMWSEDECVLGHCGGYKKWSKRLAKRGISLDHYKSYATVFSHEYGAAFVSVRAARYWREEIRARAPRLAPVPAEPVAVPV